MAFLREKKYLIILLAILIVAAFFRFYKLNSIPPGLYPDVAINGNDALNSLKTGDFKLFYPDNNGREGLFFWFIALSFAIFGPSVWAIKIVAAFFGVLTVLGTYLLTKEIFRISAIKNEALALLASFFLAISFWHVNFSRIGFRVILMPFALTYAFYFLYKAYNSKKTRDFIISSFFFAFGFYTYISYRFVIFILAAAILSWWFIYRRENSQKQFLKFTVYCLGSTFIFALPIGVYFLFHLQDFFGRAGGVSVFSQTNPLLIFLKSLIIHLGMFNFYGDANWRHNFSTSPELLWPVGIFFLIGLILTIREIIIGEKNKDYLALATHWLLISWLFFMLLPSALSYEGIPHALRSLGVIPIPYIFAAVGAFWCFEKIKTFYKSRSSLIIFYFLIAVFFASLAIAEYNKYFVVWASEPKVQGAFSTGLADVGNYLNSLPGNTDKYVVVNLDGVAVPYPDGIPMPAQTPIFIEWIKYGEPRANYILPANLNKINPKKEAVIIPLSYDQDLIGRIITEFPDGKLEKNQGIWVYKINNF